MRCLRLPFFALQRIGHDRALGRLVRGVILSSYLLAIFGCQNLPAVGRGRAERQEPTGAVSTSGGSQTNPSTTTPGSEASTNAAVQSTVLAGAPYLAVNPVSIPVGVAESFQYVASTSGMAKELVLYLDGPSQAGQILIGLYTNSPTNHPSHLLTQGRIDTTRSFAWNTVPVSPVRLTTGEKYWLTVLAPFGTIPVQPRLASSGGLAEMSPISDLHQLMSNWVPATTQIQSSVAAYVLQVAAGNPVISSVSASQVSDDTATITWTTDRPTTSQIRYGMTTSYGAETTFDPTLVTSHTQVLGGLSPKTHFNYQIISADPDGKSASANFAFTTLSASPAAAKVGEWSSVLPWPLVDVHMSLLYTGEVLMWDAWEFNGTPSVHLWNPNSQSWSPAFQTLASLPTAGSQMFCADQVMLPDGRLLVVGGHNGADIGIKNTMIFDPSTRQWDRAADMHTARWYPTATALPNGQVIALGGEITSGVDATVPEVYNPSLNTWRPLPRAALDVGDYPLTYLLPNGRLFIAAGGDDKSRTLDLATQTWTTLGTNPAATGTAAMYRPGEILVSGGGTAGADPVQSTAATIDLNKPSPAWTFTAPMIDPRYKHSLVVLADGTVLAVGGSSIYSEVSQKGVLDAELWNPDTGDWTLMAPMHDLRMYHSTALLLPDGRVLVAGGGRMSPVPDYQTAEIYSPPYLFKGPRPTMSDAPASTTNGTTFTIQTPDAARIKSVALVRLGSVTHTFDSDQRYIDLAFTASGAALKVQSPSNPNVAPPGYYMLFIVDASGVPSVAKIVKVS